MGLADVRSQVKNRRTARQPCHVELALQGLDEQDRDILLRDLFDDTLESRPLSRAWEDHGVAISDQTIRKHRARYCVRCREDGRYPESAS